MDPGLVTLQNRNAPELECRAFDDEERDVELLKEG